ELRVWATGSWRELATWNTGIGVERDRLPPQIGERNPPVVSIVVAPNSRSIAVGTIDGRILLYDVGVQTPKAWWKAYDYQWGDAAMALAISPDGKILVSGVPHSEPRAAASGKVWDIGTQDLQTNFVFHGALGGVAHHFLAFSPDGGTIAAAESGGSVALW